MAEIVLLDGNTPSIQYLCKKDKRLAKVITMVGPIEYRTHDDQYAFLVHEIIEQMLSIKAARTIYYRLVAVCGGSITPSNICALSDDQIQSIGTARSKVSYIRSVTNAVIAGELSFDEIRLLSDKDVIEKLLSIRGIGMWTAKMFLIFVLDRQDVLPYEDAAFMQAFCWMYKTDDRSKDMILKKCKKWRPYSSIAARYLYRALDGGLTRNEFRLHG